MLKKRLLSALVIVPSIFGAIFFMPSIGMLAIIIAISTWGMLEYCGMLRSAGIPTFKWAGLAAGPVLMIIAYIGYRWRAAGSTSTIAQTGEWELVALACMVLVVLVYWFLQEPSRESLMAVSSTLFGILYIPFLLSFFLKLAIVGPDMTWNTPLLGRSGCYLVCYAVFVAKFTDVGAFFVGRSLGKHKLAPRLSPSKTWEGAVGGLTVGTLTSVLFLQVVWSQLGTVHVSLLHGVILGVVLSVAAISGDLVESMLKRAVAVKDSATSVPGLGGMLDIFDSLMFTIPVFYIYAKAFLF